MSDESQVEAALAVMQAHLKALNASDETALAETLHFPHYRLSGGSLKIWNSSEAYLDDFRRRAGKSWGYTEWGDLMPVQIGADKVHMAVRVDRRRIDGSPISSFESLWVVTRSNGKWAVQFRSSFANDGELERKL